MAASRRQCGANRADETLAADGEVVWSWRRDPGATCGSLLPHNGGKKGRFPGESTYKPSNHCAGKARMSRLFLSNPCASSVALFAHGAAGAVGARLSLRPLLEEGHRSGTTRAKSGRGNVFLRLGSGA